MDERLYSSVCWNHRFFVFAHPGNKGIKPHRLHDTSRHKKYLFALRRMMYLDAAAGHSDISPRIDEFWLLAFGTGSESLCLFGSLRIRFISTFGSGLLAQGLVGGQPNFQVLGAWDGMLLWQDGHLWFSNLEDLHEVHQRLSGSQGSVSDMRKQCKRALALKQKLLLKFLSGDALQKYKALGGGGMSCVACGSTSNFDSPCAKHPRRTLRCLESPLRSFAEPPPPSRLPPFFS